MHTTQYKKNHIKVSLTLTFKADCQGQVIDFVFFKFPDLRKVRIDTEIWTVACIIIVGNKEGHNNMYLRP